MAKQELKINSEDMVSVSPITWEIINRPCTLIRRKPLLGSGNTKYSVTNMEEPNLEFEEQWENMKKSAMKLGIKL